MAHKALIGGTVYEKSGGTDLINGTVYQKNYGKTLVGGTVYEVGFAEMVTITLTGNGHATYCYITIDGVKYVGVYGEETTIDVPVGTAIDCFVGDQGKYGKAYITLNGTNVVSGVSGRTYNYTVIGAVTIQTQAMGYKDGNSTKFFGTITITEQ